MELPLKIFGASISLKSYTFSLLIQQGDNAGKASLLKIRNFFVFFIFLAQKPTQQRTCLTVYNNDNATANWNCLEFYNFVIALIYQKTW